MSKNPMDAVNQLIQMQTADITKERNILFAQNAKLESALRDRNKLIKLQLEDKAELITALQNLIETVAFITVPDEHDAQCLLDRLKEARITISRATNG